MAHRLNTNKQFMVGNGILAFAVIFVVVLFVYMSMKLQQDKQGRHRFTESYTLSLTKGFVDDSISLFINDSLIAVERIKEEPYSIKVNRFAEQNLLMIVDHKTDLSTSFALSEKGGSYRFEKREGNIVLLGE